MIFQSALAGARPVMYAATEAEPGSYIGLDGAARVAGPGRPARLGRHARDDALAAKLWDKSLAEAGVTFSF